MARSRGKRRQPLLSLCTCPEQAEGTWGTIRIRNMIWRTVLLYPESGAHRRATKFIHEQLDRLFRRSLGSWYATSEVLRMEEGSVIAHHKVYLTRKVDNITDLVTRSFNIGYRANVSQLDVAGDSIRYYSPPPPPETPAIWYLRYLTLPIAFGILIALGFETCWRTNAWAVRAPYGHIEPEDAKPRLTTRELLQQWKQALLQGGRRLQAGMVQGGQQMKVGWAAFAAVAAVQAAKSKEKLGGAVEAARLMKAKMAARRAEAALAKASAAEEGAAEEDAAEEGAAEEGAAEEGAAEDAPEEGGLEEAAEETPEEQAETPDEEDAAEEGDQAAPEEREGEESPHDDEQPGAEQEEEPAAEQEG